MRILNLLCCITLMGISQVFYAQNLQQVNNAVEYTNETLHGMFIIHRLLEMDNQEINKYVDLDSYKVNKYSNSDVPVDIFEDPNEEYYQRNSPNKIYKQIQLPANSEMLQAIKRMNGICTETNTHRHTLSNYISKNDMSSSENLGKVYEMLQRSEQLFENYYGERAYISSLRADYANQISGGVKQRELFDIYTRLNDPINIILQNIKMNKDYDLDGHVSNFEFAIRDLESYVNGKTNRTLVKTNKHIITKAKEFVTLVRSYLASEAIPKELEQYGKFYYYHNYKLLHKTNHSGLGMIDQMNEFLRKSNSPYPMFLEVPHYFKVIYPKRKEKVSRLAETPKISSNTEEVTPVAVVNEIPEVFEERQVVSSDHTVYSKSTELTVELYDHLLLDGDIVSMSFNGEWVLQNHSLEAEPKKLKLKLNPSGKNYLLLHAENLGRRPPNTIGLSYIAPEGGRKKILLRSDLEKSELIEIIVQ